MKKKQSLLRKYMMIIVGAVVLFPATMFLVSMSFSMIGDKYGEVEPYYPSGDLTNAWHEEINALQVGNPAQIEEKLHVLKSTYKEADIFWVNANGELQFSSLERGDIPKKWSVGYTIDFMKKSYNSDPFTIVAYIGGGVDNGFAVLQMPREYTKSPSGKVSEKYGYHMLVVGGVIFQSFLVVSWLFFRGIRQRLVGLQEAMKLPQDRSIPLPILISKMDEIGVLEESFNKMIKALEESRRNEQEEERVRKKLIADLSHDLRTPLTAIRAQLYTLKNEVSSAKGTHTISLIDDKIHYLGELIENLLAYTLLSSKKYPYCSQETDMMKITRKIIAGWYNKLESENFDIDVVLSPESFCWDIDVNWYERMIDNVIQNVIRHGKSGKFIGFYLHCKEGKEVITIVDKGPGFEEATSHKGAGIGLSIIAMMATEMEITWEVQSTSEGTAFIFSKQMSNDRRMLVG
jgi:signal transduction histidine kinase